MPGTKIEVSFLKTATIVDILDDDNRLLGTLQGRQLSIGESIVIPLALTATMSAYPNGSSPARRNDEGEIL